MNACMGSIMQILTSYWTWTTWFRTLLMRERAGSLDSEEMRDEIEKKEDGEEGKGGLGG